MSRPAERCLATALKQSEKDHIALALMAEVRVRQNNVNEAFSLYMEAVNARRLRCIGTRNDF